MSILFITEFYILGIMADSQLVPNKYLWKKRGCNIDVIGLNGKHRHCLHVYLEPGLSFLFHLKMANLNQI